MANLSDLIDGMVASVITNATDSDAPVRKLVIDESIKTMVTQRSERTMDVIDRAAAGMAQHTDESVLKAYRAVMDSVTKSLS